MAKFAPVAPLGILKQLLAINELGNYHLLLAHKILQAPREWEAFLEEARDVYPDLFIIMDNSLIELGEALPPAELIEAVSIAKANVVVLPDKLMDRRATLDLSAEAWKAIRPRIDALPFSVETMGVVQGKDRDDYLMCAEWLCRDSQVDYLCIPRITQKVLGSRFYITPEIYGLFSRYIHLLGFSDDIPDDIASAATYDYVMGIDSAVPLYAGIHDLHMGQLYRERPRRPKEWLEMDFRKLNQQAVANVQRVRKWVS